MTTTTAGTTQAGKAVLEGLLEGPVPPVERGERGLRDWVGFARSQGLGFELEIDGPSFTLVADPASIAAGAPRAQAFEETVRQCLEQLLDVFPSDLRHTISSTLRSREVLADEEIQCVYVVGPAGVSVRKRKVAREATGGRPRGTIDRVPLQRYVPLMAFAGVLLVVFVGSLFFIDYSEILGEMSSRYAIAGAERYEVDGAAVSRYVTLEKVGLRKGRLLVEVRRTERFPLDLAAYRSEEGRVERGGDLRALLAFRKLIDDGAMRVECLDEEGEVLGEVDVGIRRLLERESITVRVPVRDLPGAVRIRFGG